MFGHYSLHKAKKVLRQAANRYKKKKGLLTKHEQQIIETDMDKLYESIAAKDKKESKQRAKKLEAEVKQKLKKNTFEQAVEFIFAIVFALVIAFFIREMWFELYEVPTGSMRDTIEEKDRLLVSKTTFGLHLPFQKNLLFFNPDYIKRNGIIVFTSANMDIPDKNTMYFYLFPGLKRLIKRAIGKPGDTLYFYGGRIYGIDCEGNEIKDFEEGTLKKTGIEDIEHIPYITFDGKVTVSSPISYGVYSKALLHQMNIPLGKLELNQEGKIEGQFFNGKEWIKDDPFAPKGDVPNSYSQLFGMDNYAMARLLTKKEAIQFYGKEGDLDGVLILELHHTPNLTFPQPEMKKSDLGKINPVITPFTTLLPLKKEHVEAIQKALNLSRFFVQNGRAFRYQEGNQRPQPPDYDPLFPKIPDGLYEMQNGVAYRIDSFAFRKKLPSDHPLYSESALNVQKLFNLGIAFNVLFAPREANQPFLPQRFAYYREGDLYIMGKPILKKDDPVLKAFIASEKEKEKNSKYIAFVDKGPPSIKDIEIYGLKVSENGVLALGDNYTMSSDSRDFGFVPTNNLRGSPSFIFWPFTSRFGTLPQASYALFTVPFLIVWSLAIIIAILISIYYYKRQKNETLKELIKQSKV